MSPAIYDAIATLAMFSAVMLPIALIAWFRRGRPTDTRPRRTTITHGGRRMTLTSEQLPEQ